MAARNPLRRAEALLRKSALSFPDAYEEFPWGHRAIKVKGKMFVIFGIDKEELYFTVKLPVSGKIALSLPFAKPTEYGLGKSGWVTARFGPRDAVPVDMLQEWIDESFRAIAPKRILAALENSAPAGKRAARRR